MNIVRDLTIKGIDILMTPKVSKEPLPINDQISLQVLESVDEEQISKLILSDGNSQIEVYTRLRGLLQQIQQLGKESYPIIKIQNFISKRKSEQDQLLTIICQAEIIESQINYIVGHPIDYSEYLKKGNPKGSNKLREISINRSQPQTESKNQTKLPVRQQAVRITISSDIQNQIESSSNFQTKTNQNQKVVVANSNKKPQNQPIQKIQQLQDKNSYVYTPIQHLYPLMEHWMVKARCTFKSEKREFINKSKNTTGHYFNFDLIDESGKINCVAFNEACYKFYDQIVQGKMYEISRGSIKVNRYSGANKHNYQVTLEEYSVVNSREEDGSIRNFEMNLIKIDEILKKSVGQIIDLLGIVLKISPMEQVKLKSGEQKVKRTFFLYDDSTSNIEVTFWGDKAEKLNIEKDDIIALSNLKITSYNQNNQLQSQSNTIILTQQQDLVTLAGYDIDFHIFLISYTQLYGWFEKNKDKVVIEMNTQERSNNPITYCSKVHADSNEQQDTNYSKYNEVRAYFQGFNTKNGIYYSSCTKCPKKLQQNENTWFCETCRMNISEPNYKFVFTAKIVDVSGSIWVTVHDSQATQLLGVTAKQYIGMDEAEQKKKFNSLLNLERRFLLQSRVENYQGVIRPRHQIIKMLPEAFEKDAKEILQFVLDRI